MESRPPQNVVVLAVLGFQIPCFRLETPALYPSSLFTNHEKHERKKDARDDLRDGKRASKIQDGVEVVVLRRLDGIVQ